MSRILVIESSARQQGSVSRQLTADFIAQWQAAHPQDEVTVRDLAKQPVPHLDETLLAGWMKPSEQQNDAEKAAAARSNELTDEVLAADVLVLAAPMYNVAIPSTLKAWLDHVLRAGVTFKYTETGQLAKGCPSSSSSCSLCCAREISIFMPEARAAAVVRRRSPRADDRIPRPGCRRRFPYGD